ncbi:MAG TPA: hypothetical protein VGD37_34320 [Kofleriaceae bacterium]
MAVSVFASAGLVAAGTGCHGRAPTPRERVLAGLPADVEAVAVADGRALSHPRVRGVLDVLAARLPASLGCLVDAAVASEAVGVAIDRASNITALVALRQPPRCAALSQREPGLWIATLGAGPATAASVLDDPRFARARPYLETSPIAGVALGDLHVLAAAQPEPFDAWVTIDVPGGADPIAQAVAEQLAKLQREPATAPLVARIHTARPGPTQLVVRLTGPLDVDLAAAVRTALAWLDAAAEPHPATAAAFSCARPTPEVRCLDGKGTSYQVTSLPEDMAQILTVGHPTPIVINGSVTGLRLDSAVPAFGLEAGDVLVAAAGRLVTSRTMLTDRIAHARGATSLTIRRGGTETVVTFAER